MMLRLMFVALLVPALASFGCGGTNAGSVTCGRAAPNPHPSDAFATLQYGMVATWNGTATTPDGWVPATNFSVAISFAADGTYSAQTTDDSGSLPFYYDRNPESDRYELVDLHANGDGSGNLYLEWLSAPDQLAAVRFDAEQTHLHFEYTHDGNGPVVYELDCTP